MPSLPGTACQRTVTSLVPISVPVIRTVDSVLVTPSSSGAEM